MRLIKPIVTAIPRIPPVTREILSLFVNLFDE